VSAGNRGNLDGEVGPMDFSTFVISLGSNALMQVSAEGDSALSDEALALARQSIDILEMLEKKTDGNLTEDEAGLLKAVLYQTRIAFIEARDRA
jgi:hypothetical protein